MTVRLSASLWTAWKFLLPMLIPAVSNVLITLFSSSSPGRKGTSRVRCTPSESTVPALTFYVPVLLVFSPSFFVGYNSFHFFQILSLRRNLLAHQFPSSFRLERRGISPRFIGAVSLQQLNFSFSIMSIFMFLHSFGE